MVGWLWVVDDEAFFAARWCLHGGLTLWTQLSSTGGCWQRELSFLMHFIRALFSFNNDRQYRTAFQFNQPSAITERVFPSILSLRYACDAGFGTRNLLLFSRCCACMCMYLFFPSHHANIPNMKMTFDFANLMIRTHFPGRQNMTGAV
jgi:hypothetical protein